MTWSGFEIPHFFIVENNKQCINLNAGYITNVTFDKVRSNFNIFKHSLENSPNEFQSMCGSMTML